jgi:hypothetical protein
MAMRFGKAGQLALLLIFALAAAMGPVASTAAVPASAAVSFCIYKGTPYPESSLIAVNGIKHKCTAAGWDPAIASH